MKFSPGKRLAHAALLLDCCASRRPCAGGACGNAGADSCGCNDSDDIDDPKGPELKSDAGWPDARRGVDQNPRPCRSKNLACNRAGGSDVSDGDCVPGAAHRRVGIGGNDNAMLTSVRNVGTMLFLAFACTLVAVDGDTLRCGEELIRLIGIDAPELPGHCREGRNCAPGDPFESKRGLEALSRGVSKISRQGRDVYGRTLARVEVGGVDLSCAQIASGRAVYRSDWDQFGLVGIDCGVAKRVAAAPPSRVAQRGRGEFSASPGASGWSYRNCAEARRAGAAPLLRGTPGYGIHMDGDRDGIACEPPRR